MLSFKEFLNESFKNLLPKDIDQKSKYADEVFSLIQKAYADQNGIHGSGFRNPLDMVKNIPMWKMSMLNGKVTGVALYKDKEGRKRVAIATDGSDHGKKAIGEVMKEDLRMQRAYMEVSGKSLSFLKKQVNVLDFARDFDAVKKTLSDDEITRPPADDPEVKRHPELADYFYQRKISGESHTKIMLGKTGNKLY